MFFKSYTFTWWQVAIFKLALLAVGAAIGCYWFSFFRSILALLIIIAVIAGLYILFICLKQSTKEEEPSLEIEQATEKTPETAQEASKEISAEKPEGEIKPAGKPININSASS